MLGLIKMDTSDMLKLERILILKIYFCRMKRKIGKELIGKISVNVGLMRGVFVKAQKYKSIYLFLDSPCNHDISDPIASQ